MKPMGAFPQVHHPPPGAMQWVLCSLWGSSTGRVPSHRALAQRHPAWGQGQHRRSLGGSSGSCIRASATLYPGGPAVHKDPRASHAAYPAWLRVSPLSHEYPRCLGMGEGSEPLSAGRLHPLLGCTAIAQGCRATPKTSACGQGRWLLGFAPQDGG